MLLCFNMLITLISLQNFNSDLWITLTIILVVVSYGFIYCHIRRQVCCFYMAVGPDKHMYSVLEWLLSNIWLT